MSRQFSGVTLFLLLSLSGCRSSERIDGQVVVVRCFRDLNAAFEPWLSRASYEFSITQPRTKSGKPILVSTYESTDFQKALADVGPRLHPDLVFVSSASQIPPDGEISKGLKDAKDICPNQSACLAFIPSWVQGDQRDATEVFMDYLRTHR